MGRLTPNYADKTKPAAVAARIRRAKPNGKPHVEATHEPLASEVWPFAQVPAQLTNAGSAFPNLTVTLAPPAVAPAAEPVPLKVAIIGTAPSSRHLAPFADTSWQIWACSPGNMGQIPRADVWFELHNNLLYPENKHYGEPYLKWLQEQAFPVYMQDRDTVPRATVFPKEELVAEFGRFFFTSSFAWMMAFAMKQGAKEIALYGVDMASRDEYILQRPGGHYFMELARQRGIKVTVPNESDLAQPPGLYGYSDSSPFGRKLSARRTEIKNRIAQMAAERDKLIQNITYLQGADEDMDYVQSIWSGLGG